MPEPARIYVAIGGASGCRALATAFYARVAQDPLLRPLFPSTFRCAIEEFAAFLVQFLGGEAEAAQRRWWLSLRESHRRFKIGQRERSAWLRAMTATLNDPAVIADTAVRGQLMEFFIHSSAHVVNRAPESRLSGELSLLWKEQVALDEAVRLISSQDTGEECIDLLRGAVLQARFARSPAVHASVLALAATSKNRSLRDYAVDQIRARPSLIHERYKGGRTALYDASGAGDANLVELLLDLGADASGGDNRTRSPLYSVANECSAPGASLVVRALLRRSPGCVNATHGVKRCTALHMAARRGNTEVIAALLDGGADIEARDSAGVTPLGRAVNCKKVEAARLLLARGANPDSG